MKKSALIEAILFHKAEPLKIKRLAEVLALSEDETMEALNELENDLQDRGLGLIRHKEEVTLATNKEAAPILENMSKEELSQDLGKAALETLAIVAYRQEVTRAEIDYIRGVNSSFILRNLMIRGLIERIQNPSDSRGYIYRPTFDMLSHLGIGNITELPEFNEIQEELKEFMATNNEEDNETKS